MGLGFTDYKLWGHCGNSLLGTEHRLLEGPMGPPCMYFYGLGSSYLSAL